MKKSINYSISFLILLFVSLSLVACKDDKDEDIEPEINCESSVDKIADANTILSESTWEWVESRSEGRNGEIVITPQTEGKTMSLAFSLGASVEELENGIANNIWTYRIDVSNDTTLGAFNSVWIDADGNVDRNYYLDVCPELLKLTDASSSLMTVTTYKKK
ncbi:hypothetical protein Fleli_1877 [Bernardetia litoralis DSM 6794]|uniref:Lipocalin-like domain-containing protein n=1 Tax=Bernardetia litoralis (strain ATCC 23117 / DSM 6794 / NBRC 15988 / NCIMB 1366 / Fx l1 / Sio-4) TaxID=880071 RepID=I4AJY9_BERLS|nr:hypothetical protein [Bernardetia litoralis]AFM04274.1 hypothetical protein Fleli_1877 [Bernardetia litoralis DSM 6794]